MKCVAAHLILKIPRRIKMTDTNEIHSVKDLILKNEELEARNEFLQRQVKAARFRNTELRRELDRVTSLGMFEFANEFCNDSQLEDAGHAFARSLGVGMTHEEIEIEKAENAYIPYTAEDF